MAISKEDSLKKTRDMWSWLYSEMELTGVKKTKRDYLKYMGILEDDFPVNDCYLCKHDRQKGDYYVSNMCLFCPIPVDSWLGEGCKPVRVACNKKGSPFYKYINAKSIEEAIEGAKGIIELCNTELRRLESEK